MKTLNTYITEWKASLNNENSIKRIGMFVYEINETDINDYTSKKRIKIFDKDWPLYKKFRKNVRINGEQVSLFGGYTEKKYRPGIYTIEVDGINNNITDTSWMFHDCKDLVSVQLFNTSYVKNMDGMFNGTKITEVPLFDTNKVETMDYMFYQCYNITEIPLFDTRNVKSMKGMFSQCKNLEYVPKFNVNNLVRMDETFYMCNKLNEESKKYWSQIYDFETNRQII